MDYLLSVSEELFLSPLKLCDLKVRRNLSLLLWLLSVNPLTLFIPLWERTLIISRQTFHGLTLLAAVSLQNQTFSQRFASVLFIYLFIFALC